MDKIGKNLPYLWQRNYAQDQIFLQKRVKNFEFNIEYPSSVMVILNFKI